MSVRRAPAAAPVAAPPLDRLAHVLRVGTDNAETAEHDDGEPIGARRGSMMQLTLTNEQKQLALQTAQKATRNVVNGSKTAVEQSDAIVKRTAEEVRRMWNGSRNMPNWTANNNSVQTITSRFMKDLTATVSPSFLKMYKKDQDASNRFILDSGTSLCCIIVFDAANDNVWTSVFSTDIDRPMVYQEPMKFTVYPTMDYEDFKRSFRTQMEQGVVSLKQKVPGYMPKKR